MNANGILTIGSTIIQCEYCGQSHIGMCQRIKSIEYRKNGKVKRVELHPSGLQAPLAGSVPHDKTDSTPSRIIVGDYPQYGSTSNPGPMIYTLTQ